MFNLQQFIADHVICRPTSMFAADIEANKETLQAEIRNKSVCVIGGAGSIGSSFIKAVLPFKPSKLIVIDLNENGLAELTRDLRFHIRHVCTCGISGIYLELCRSYL